MMLRLLAKALGSSSLVLFAGAFFATALVATTAIAGDCNTDLNGDGATDEADVAIFQGTLGKSAGDEGYVSAADLNGDGTVTAADYAIFLSCN
jgi:Dockerin type I domain